MCIYDDLAIPDVRFKNQGLDSIEVQDNGDGISPHNYETLALKHHTSKLSTYSDLTTLQTFGFRGEALSSLCALSKFSVVTCMAADAPKGTKLDFHVSGKLKDTGVVAAQKGTLVSVEHLFNNLPVRRRELERNIKREWTRVTGVLGQYACIQTGIKFSVSQQAGKGKKTTLFSTKGNQNTRENIMNVFGAKTLTALITLDLNLELEASSAPSQRRSTQDDGGTKEIRITGHISRPASGEGRQTPDRQMFFVNARPCGLPQVAKAFNEVYKAYNGTQSPFIFANIELDTHLYDVNVSPDKRTILLHDQNRMLENLKEELTKLFESQAYTVPISQLPAQKQLSYKQLTISRENSIGGTRNSQSPAMIASGEVSEDARSARSASRREESTTFKSNIRHGAVSRDSMSRDSSAINLISKWAGRQSEDRPGTEKEASILPKKATSAPAGGLSEEKRRLVEQLRREGEKVEAAPDASADSDVSDEEIQSMSTPTSEMKPPPPVPIFAKGNSEVSSISSSTREQSRYVSQSVEPEMSISALESPPQASPSIAAVFSNTARIQRAPGEMATISIGDHTVTSTIGNPSKNTRIDNVSSSACTKRSSQAQVPKGSLPTFGKSLSQMFAASSTTKELVPAGEIEEGSDVERGDATPVSEEFLGTEGVMDVADEDDDDDDDEGLFVPQSPRSNSIVKQEDLGLNASILPNDDDEADGEYVDEEQKKALEEAKVQNIIEQAEKSGVQPSQETSLRAKSLLKGGSKKKDATVNLARMVETSISKIAAEHQALNQALSQYQVTAIEKAENEALDSAQAEEKLSLTISKSDFAKMRIVGQFNLGFILATRSSGAGSVDNVMTADDMFIIDQHASDEKYNFERLYATTIVQSQRLVYPKTLDLTALEEEIVMENVSALETNGFIVTVDDSGDSPVGKRCQLTSLPISRETAFSLTDLEELIALLAEYSPGLGPVPRPSKVRKMFAMRACRSSIMIGKTLTGKQMGKVVRHLGELDKPWNCPHGRPTMRHLCGLGEWDGVGWKEGDALDEGGDGDGDRGRGVGRVTDWATWLRGKRDGEAKAEAEDEEGDDEEGLSEDEGPAEAEAEAEEHDFEIPDATHLGEEEDSAEEQEEQEQLSEGEQEEKE